MGVLLCVVGPAAFAAGEVSGYVAAEYRYFPNDPLESRQDDDTMSLVVQPEYYIEWDGGYQSFTFVPFARLDQQDDERTHFDIRDLSWLKVGDDWELRVGIRKVFWGVTEAQHLVDIINQTDLVEFPDGEEKLGQPMVNLAFVRDWGTVDLFVLPYFRERTFPGKDGRLRTIPRIETDQATYDSSRKKKRIDLAARWAIAYSYWDLGLSYFYGTSRDPRFSLGIDKKGEVVLAPFYEIISQFGIDAQATIESWLWKFEMIRRSGNEKNYTAATGGFEYTFFGALDTAMDVGLVLEYLYDDQGNDALTPFEDDIASGLRLTLNDEQSTEALLGAIYDVDDGWVAYSLEASRRIGANWKLNIDGRIYGNANKGDLLRSFRKDDFLQLELAYYF